MQGSYPNRIENETEIVVTLWILGIWAALHFSMPYQHVASSKERRNQWQAKT